MILMFRTMIGGMPTYFIEKIIASIKHKEITNEMANILCDTNNPMNWDKMMAARPKIHTIREDKSNRWEKGKLIHFVINARTPRQFQFAPIMCCQRVSKIVIRYHKSNNANKVSIKVDGKEVNIHELAVNDGFDSAGDFLDYFNRDFDGKIIHWTDFKY